MARIKVKRLSHNVNGTVVVSVDKDKFDAEMKEVRAEILRVEERKRGFYKTRESMEKAAKRPSTYKRLGTMKKQSRQHAAKRVAVVK